MENKKDRAFINFHRNKPPRAKKSHISPSPIKKLYPKKLCKVKICRMVPYLKTFLRVATYSKNRCVCLGIKRSPTCMTTFHSDLKFVVDHMELTCQQIIKSIYLLLAHLCRLSTLLSFSEGYLEKT